MGCLSLVSIIMLACLSGAADEFINEEPPLYVEGDLLDVEQPIIAEEEKPLVFPEEMPAAAQIIVEATEDLSDLNYTGINWKEFYADFQPLELNITKELNA